ncbi:MAG: metal ABC transporter permease [Chlorobium sp.]|uniref:metal ABC transporter permease n=1 Tax=Chlorobium sp. TaxID=1095 RepID=UPI0025C1D43D|nr:metal ABC transporter permease [Chlorobium sp.]MCF8216675.1 metal ABC transporter permease [Chlorobium sp.]MCF8270864.1 metal ABC transporter permease [Chlorobium sp.]MCF8287202.1 metal ABC transporter permease [Chlorobium sp.]MCF8290859.1 metal ABC transporter permease [Chlorobium sp.]MCF8385624.1 metal ABC transporter permease [Chlorobium sp.]
MPGELFAFEFLRNAALASLLASIACGIIGSYVVVKKIGFISGGIAHTAFGGIGLGYYLGVNPLFGVIPFSLGAAIAIGLLSRKAKVAEDTAIGAFWAVGMATGVILIGLTPGYAPNLFSYLFGNILTVPTGDLWMICILDLSIAALSWLFSKEFLAISFDEEYAEVSGVKTTFFYLLLLCLIALTVVILMRVVGIVLVIALLTIPAAIARLFSRSIGGMMLLASLLSALFCLAGLWVSYILDLASGATIIVLAGSAFLLVHAGRHLISFARGR